MAAARKFSIGTLAVASSLAIVVLPSAESFSPTSPCVTSSRSSISESSSTCLWSIFDDDKEEVSTGGGVDFASFNPLKYNQASGKGAVQNPQPFGQISLRKVRMQDMTGELLNAVGDEAATNEILNRFQDFLLQPLEDPDTILEPDSIYTPHMSRAERYEAYRTSMDERIQNSKNGSVRSVLQSMRDFVLRFEEK